MLTDNFDIQINREAGFNSDWIQIGTIDSWFHYK